jgi:hypothetical protein
MDPAGVPVEPGGLAGGTQVASSECSIMVCAEPPVPIPRLSPLTKTICVPSRIFGVQGKPYPSSVVFVMAVVGNIEMDRPPGITPTNDGILWNLAFAERNSRQVQKH